MEFLIKIWEFFQYNILTKPAFFIGIIVFIGYMLIGRKFYEAFSGFIKATVGYLILMVASGGLVSNFRPVLAALRDRFNLKAAVIDPYFGQAAAQKAVEDMGRAFTMMIMVLLVAFSINIIFVLFRKITKIRTVFITGHVMVQQSSTALLIILFCFEKLNDPRIVVMLGLLLGTYWSVASNLTVQAAQNLTEGGGFALGHQQGFGVWLVDKVAKKVGGKGKKLEDLKFPGFLSIFNDNIVATSVLMLLFFGVIITVLGADIMHKIDSSFGKNQNFAFYIIEKSLNFAVYLSILQLGVRMFVSELTESFQGISTKLLPGAMPAIDCAAFYAFGHPNAITLGFLFGALGQFISIAGLIIFKSPVFIITGFVPVFFDNATLAVFANHKGGVRAVVILTFISGMVQVLGGAFAAFYFGLAEYGGWHGNLDWDTVWPLFGVIMKNLHYIGYAIVLTFLLVIPQLQYLKNKKYYFMMAEDYDAYLKSKNAGE